MLKPVLLCEVCKLLGTPEDRCLPVRCQECQNERGIYLLAAVITVVADIDPSDKPSGNREW